MNNGKNLKIVAILLSLVLMLTMSPASFADISYAESRLPEIDYGTPGEDYEPGQVIVCVEGGTQALMASGIFSGKTGKVDGEKIKLEDTLIEFETDESNVDKAAAISVGDEQGVTEAINDESSEEEEFSLVLINSNKDDISSLIEKLNQLDCVKFAEPNVKCELTSFTSEDAKKEPSYKYQWYLDKEATNTDFDINAEAAYKKLGDSNQKEVVVAVMDTGVDYNHPDLKASMWTADDELITKIGGGEHGINTVDGEDKRYPMDSEIGHGTHCASTIASTWKNNTGIAGINGNAKIMACKFFGNGYIKDWVEAMDYVLAAKENGVNVVATNNSWGPDFSLQYCGGITEMMADIAGEKGIVTCFAAGNSEYDHDKYPNFAYSSPYIVTVGAMQSNGESAYFSEIGKRTVDVFAPGTQVLAATSSYNNPNLQMAPQYIPWIQSSNDSIAYQDFKEGSSPISCEAYISSSSDGYANPTEISVEDSNIGYADEKSKQVELTELTGVSKDDELSFVINIPKSELPAEATSDAYYMAFQAGIKNASIYIKSNIHRGFLEYLSSDETWTNIKNTSGGLTGWRAIDDNWSISNCKFSKDTMKEFINIANSEKGVLKIRLRFRLDEIDGTPEFHFDNFGIGTKPSQYYYADGTSMATPCTAGVVSLIASARNTEPKTGGDALEIIARLKGGVKKTGKLDEECITQGCVQATSAFAAESELNPVPNSVKINEDNTATIDGYFFGTEEGTVKIGNNTISGENITSWGDKSITVKIPDDVKYKSYEYVITRNDNKSGRNFGVFRQNQNIEGNGYHEIPISNIEYDVEYDEVREVKTEDLLPVRIAANDDGIMVLLADEDGVMEDVLQYYSFSTGEWSKVSLNLLGEDANLDIGTNEQFASIVGSGHKFYFLATTYWDALRNSAGTYERLYGYSNLITFETSSNSCKQENVVKVDDAYNVCSALALGANDRLYVALGTMRNDTRIRELNPKSGKLEVVSNMGSLPESYLTNRAGAGSFLISGNTQVIVGARPVLDAILYDSPVGGASLRASIRKGNSTWNMVNADILDCVDGGMEYAQNELAAYGALDQGFIMTGPAKNVGTENMVDTWYYDASTNSYEELPARVDPERLRAQAGVSYGGRFYVMGNSHSRGNKLFLKYLKLNDFGLSVSKPDEISQGGGGSSGGGEPQKEPEAKTTDAEPVVNYDSEESGLNVEIEGLTEGVDYKVVLPEYATRVGTHKATIVFIGDYSKMENKTITYVVLPKGSEIKKISAKKKSITVNLKKQTKQTTGYQIRYSLKSSMKSSKSVTIKKNTLTKKTIKNLKSKKKYYVQTRTYTKVKEGKSYKDYYSHWSIIKSVKVK